MNNIFDKKGLNSANIKFVEFSEYPTDIIVSAIISDSNYDSVDLSICQVVKIIS